MWCCIIWEGKVSSIGRLPSAQFNGEPSFSFWYSCCLSMRIYETGCMLGNIDVKKYQPRKDWSSTWFGNVWIFFPSRGRKFAALMIASAINRTLNKTSTSVRRRQHTTFSFTSPRQSHQRFIWYAALLCLICWYVCELWNWLADQKEPNTCVPLAVGRNAVDAVDER